MASNWTITADKFLTEDQTERLLTVLKTNKELAESGRLRKQNITDYYIIRVLLGSGLRVAEFCDLRVSDFATNLNVRCGKGGKARTILLTSDTQEVLGEWIKYRGLSGYSTDPEAFLFPNPQGGRITTRAIQSRIKLAFKVVGLPPSLSTHSLRHSYCSFLLKQRGVSIATVKSNMGHSSIGVTNLYSHAIGSLEGINLLSSRKSSQIQKEHEVSTSSEQLLSLLTALLRSTNFSK